MFLYEKLCISYADGFFAITEQLILQDVYAKEITGSAFFKR